ncbi:TonB-dependent receptor [uncultured Bacteroides sp.]|uniref:SusC/RagA family TonB-linked outer membrane protein n=1 Tax=uncultured Bacteroides sp. TaxID=162156 RepID=UPI002627EA34|nr:TonB-dependent receptor [uncultured Bacteroides sp.]
MENNKRLRLFGRMHFIQWLFLTALFSVVAMSGYAQGKTVTGKIIDSTGEPVIGASVLVKGTTNGVISDIDGNFSIQGVANDATLQISFVGYKSQEISVAGKTRIDVTLSEDTEMLDEVVVVGYGVQKKTDVTGALTRVDSEALNTKPVSNAFEALQGKAAGVDITSNQRPGEIGSIRIRGNRSLTASNSPLYVVDGVPLSAGGIETLNPRDIESIDILKDASSTAIYGSRGANGVVLVTTKRGKTGQFSLNYSGTVTVEKLHDLQPSMSASDMITFVRWARYNANPDINPRGDQPSYEKDMNYFTGNPGWANIEKGWVDGVWNPSLVTNYDWGDLVTETGITHEHTLSGSGGTEKIMGSFSVGYLSNDGTQKGQKYQRYNFASTVDITPKTWFKMGASMNISYTEQLYGYSRTGQTGTSSGPTDIYIAAKALPNYALPYDEAGDIINMPAGSENNSYTVMDEWKKSNDNREGFRALGSFFGQVDFGEIWKPLKGLSYKIAFGPDFRYRRNGVFIDASSAGRAGGKNYVTWGSDRYFSWTLDNMILFNRQFGKHTVGVTLLQTASKFNHESASMSGVGYPYPSMLWNNMGIIDILNKDYSAKMGTGFSENQLASYMARVNYNFDERFLLTVSGRYDGSSVLAKGNKWAFFPSAAVGWRINQEEWLRDVSWLDNLKLRVGIGVTGNSAVGAYGTLGVVSQYNMPGNGKSDSYTIITPNEPYYSSSSNKMPNKKLGWEKTTQWNYGIDFGFLGNRITGTIDIYHSRTKDLLMAATIPTLSGYPSMTMNVGETKNFGIEFGVDFTPVRTKDFEWISSINTAYQKDEIVSLLNGKQDMIGNGWFIGQSIGVFFTHDQAGLWQDTPEDRELMEKFNANGHNFQPGLVRPVDQNGDFRIDEEDRVIIGNTNPKWTMGWSNTFTWKGLELAIELYGRFGYMISTGGQALSGAANQVEVDYWTPENTDAKWQKPIYQSSRSSGDPYAGLLGYEDASFLKVRNLSLGYNFSKNLCQRMGLNSLKVYVQGRNLGNLYSSVDYVDLDFGTSFYNRGVTFGLNVGF